MDQFDIKPRIILRERDLTIMINKIRYTSILGRFRELIDAISVYYTNYSLSCPPFLTVSV